MQDMGPSKDRSIRNIPVPASHRRTAAPRAEGGGPRRRARGRWVWLAVSVVVVCTVGGLLLSTLFAGASIVVHPRTASIDLPSTIPATAHAEDGSLGYVTMTLTRSATTTVPATGTQQVSRAASGVITIYNAYSTASQRLITNTRFEAPDGKIYRIHDSVVVPGAAKQADGSLDPGSVSVSVYADSPGAEYNRGATHFTIPGFKSDPRFDKFYGETQSITGGFVGTEPAVAAVDLARAQTELERGLQSAIESSVTSQMPDGFAPVGGTLSITNSDITQTAGGGNTAQLSQTATGIIAIVRVTDLAATVAGQQITGYGGEAVSFGDPTSLAVSVATATKPTGPLDLVVSGSPSVVWLYDQEALKKALIGKPKSSFESIVESFKPAIAGAEAKVRPFWQSSFPGDPAKITITTE